MTGHALDPDFGDVERMQLDRQLALTDPPLTAGFFRILREPELVGCDRGLAGRGQFQHAGRS